MWFGKFLIYWNIDDCREKEKGVFCLKVVYSSRFKTLYRNLFTHAKCP